MRARIINIKGCILERISATSNFIHNAGDHVARYIWASNKLKNKTTLDCGCGEAYGTRWLNDKDINIVGLDNSINAIKSAIDKTSSWNNLIIGDVQFMPFRTESFEAVVSFEVLEHLENGRLFLDEIIKILRSNGIFIGSTPIRKPKRYKNNRPRNPFHKREYNIKEINYLLKSNFKEVKLYGQKFPNNLIGIFLSQIYKMKMLQNQYGFYSIRENVTNNDEKCLWEACSIEL